MVSKQTLEAIGTRKGREADEGKAPKGVELMFGMKDTAWYSVERDAAKCKIHRRLHLNDVGSIKPLQNTQGFNVAMTRFPSRAEKHRGEPLSIIFKKLTIMKDLIDLLTNEERDFNFPWWVYAFVLPILMVLLMGFAGWMDTLA